MGENERETKKDADPVKQTRSKTFFFGFGALTDQMSHQAFQLLVFTYYFAVLNVNVNYLAIGFVVFAIWDSINDPLIGPISDRTVSRFGRRGFWVLVSIIPFAIINLLLFTAPRTGDIVTTIYMIIIIMLYDLFYSIFSSQQTALFPEMFKDEKERAHSNVIKNILTIVGVLVGFVLPTIIISPMAPTEEVSADAVAQMYLITGIFLAILVVTMGLIFFKFGIKERPAEIIKPQEMPSLIESLKLTLKNKTFITFVVANLFNWFVFKMLTTIIPLYGQYVLGIEKGNFMLTILLLVAFLTAAAMFPVMQKLGLKFGMRNAFIITDVIWVFALIPFAFFDGIQDQYLALVSMVFMGVGLAGTMYFVDIIIGSIIDEDEIQHGKRREGSFYGVNALINRYSTILVFTAIAIVLSGYGWSDYLISANIEEITNLKVGLKILMVGLNIIFLAGVIILLKIFPLHGERLAKVNKKIKEIRLNQSNNI